MILGDYLITAMIALLGKRRHGMAAVSTETPYPPHTPGNDSDEYLIKIPAEMQKKRKASLHTTSPTRDLLGIKGLSFSVIMVVNEQTIVLSHAVLTRSDWQRNQRT
jgi:hypothetical protein